MIYSEKFDRYIDEDLVIYRWDKNLDKLVQCKLQSNYGYPWVYTKLGYKFVHRVVWETFMEEIPDGYEIDHINAVRTDYRLENLKVVTHKENINNPITKLNMKKASKIRGISLETIKKGNIARKGKPSWNAGLHGEEYMKHYKSSVKNVKETDKDDSERKI